MEEDYNQVIESLRSLGKTDDFIVNTLVYDPRYGIDPSRAKVLVGVFNKKKDSSEITGMSASQPSGIALDSSSEEGQRVEAAYANPSIDDTKLEPSIKQWRDYSLASGINMDVNMYDVEDMKMAYVDNAVAWSISNNKFDEGVTKEDILGDGKDKEFDPEKIGVAVSEYAKFFKENEEKTKGLAASEEQMLERESSCNVLGRHVPK